MEFDKSKVLTVVTADQAKVGMKGWFGETLSALEKRVEKEPSKVLERVLLSGDRRYIFMTNNDSWSLFYPAPELTYAERQAEWVKENNVKKGTMVRVTRTFTSYEDGCCTAFVPEKGTFVGDDCTVDTVSDWSIDVRSNQKGDWWKFPYFVLEVVKEPTYRPFNNDELNSLVGEVLTNKQSGRKKLVTGKPTASEGVNLDGSYITAKDLLASFYRNTDKPCGVREDK